VSTRAQNEKKFGQWDGWVNALYGLTPEGIRLVEASAKK
jgi:hypothetical protein